MPPARISLTLSRHFSLSFITSGRSSGLHPVSSNNWCTYVLAGRPALARSYVGVHWSTSLMSSSLLLQQCPAYLVRLTWIVFVMGGRRPYSWCFVVARSCLILLASKWCIHTAVSTRPLLGRNRLILSVRSDFHMTDSLSIAVHAFVSRVSMSFSVDETLLPRYVNQFQRRFRQVWKCGLLD